MRFLVHIFIFGLALSQVACQDSSPPSSGPRTVTIAPGANEAATTIARPQPAPPREETPVPSTGEESPAIPEARPTVNNGTPASPTPAKPAGPPSSADTEIADLTWLPQSIDLKCGTKFCPPSVGMLVAITGHTSTDATFTRCTATLIASDRILTAGHCDLANSQASFFVLGPGRTRQFRLITAALHHEYDPSNEPVGGGARSAKIAPDVAILQLESAIVGVETSPLTNGQQDVYDHLTAYVVNERPRGKNDQTARYELDELRCRVQATSYWPFNIFESPNLMYLTECKTSLGNSGGPFFDPGVNQVQAMLQDGNFDEKIAIGINLHCLSKKGVMPADCKSVTAETIRARQIKSARPS